MPARSHAGSTAIGLTTRTEPALDLGLPWRQASPCCCSPARTGGGTPRPRLFTPSHSWNRSRLRRGIMRPRTRYHERYLRTEPVVWRFIPGPWSRAHLAGRSGSGRRSAEAAASIVGDPQASALEAQALVPGTFLASAAGLCGMLPWPRAPAFQRRNLWLHQASARRALAVPPCGSSVASATAAMPSRCSPEPPVRSRRLPSAAA